jgi:hypothetical protein
VIFGGKVFGETREEMRNEFDALGFAAAEGGAGLTQVEVAQAGVTECLEGFGDAREGGEELEGLGDGEFEDLGDVAASELDVERLATEAPTVAGLASHECRRQEAHFDFDATGTVAFRATALGAIKGEATGGVASQAGFRDLGKQASDFVEEADIRGRYGTRGAADGRLVNLVNGAEGFPAGYDLALR